MRPTPGTVRRSRCPTWQTRRRSLRHVSRTNREYFQEKWELSLGIPNCAGPRHVARLSKGAGTLNMRICVRVAADGNRCGRSIRLMTPVTVSPCQTNYPIARPGRLLFTLHQPNVVRAPHCGPLLFDLPAIFLDSLYPRRIRGSQDPHTIDSAVRGTKGARHACGNSTAAMDVVVPWLLLPGPPSMGCLRGWRPRPGGGVRRR